MCFYSVVDYNCGDWKWGNMRQQCPRVRRIGLTCGAKLPHHETSVRLDQACTICTHIATKQRRIARAREALQWRRKNGPHEFKTTIEKAEQEIRELMGEIAELESRRPSVANSRPGKVEEAVILPRIDGLVRDDRHGPRDHRHRW